MGAIESVLINLTGRTVTKEREREYCAQKLQRIGSDTRRGCTMYRFKLEGAGGI